eukprot:4536123-Heterocapsa_arctica.AAC.1
MGARRQHRVHLLPCTERLAALRKELRDGRLIAGPSASRLPWRSDSSLPTRTDNRDTTRVVSAGPPDVPETVPTSGASSRVGPAAASRTPVAQL